MRKFRAIPGCPALRLAFILAVLLAAGPAAMAEPLVRDLGQGLVYFRLHELPGDLPPPRSGAKGACILDLRFVRADPPAAAALVAWVKFNATARSPVFILENASTEGRLIGPFARGKTAGLITLGPAAAGFTPDLALDVSAKADRQAYDALEKGTPIEALLADNPGKQRVDEALLTREHLSDSDIPDETTEARANGPSTPPPLIDAVLQRALQLHRTLVALRRL